MLVISLLSILLVFIYIKLRSIYKYWEKKGITHLKPRPFVGNMAPNFFRRQALPYLIDDLYKAHPDKRYIGIYQFLEPILLLRDPNLIKTVAVKEFGTFPDHSIFQTSENDTVSNRALFISKSKTGWHEMRATLSPSFTSSKLKTMFLLMDHCAEQFVNYFEKKAGIITLHMKDTFTRYTNDVIASTAFGITCDSLENPQNDCYLMGKHISNFGGLRALIFFGYAISPRLMKLFDMRTCSNKASSFFDRIVKETIKIREEKGIIRPDMIHLLMEARKLGAKKDDSNDIIDTGFAVSQESEVGHQQTQKIEIIDDDIVAQAIGFYLAGFDTSSTVLSYISYELATHPDVQEKLRDEVRETLENCNGKITYEAVLGMKYLDCVVSETLRLWPPAVYTDRTSIAPFTLKAERSDENNLQLEPKTVCWIPIYSIHRDPEYYHDPEKFIPERFSDENKHNIKPFTYIPFGVGPRVCLGSRFALLEMKLLVIKILEKFDIVPVATTKIPVELGKDFGFLPHGDVCLGLKRR